MANQSAVIVGAGTGLSASIARLLAERGYDLVLGARDTGKLADLAMETEARCVPVDGSDPVQMAQAFENLPSPLKVAIYNPSARVRGPIADLDPEAVARDYVHLIEQNRSVWSSELTLRPWIETF